MQRLRIFRSLEEARQGFAPSAVTIGNFDGVHAGHRELMRRTVRLARELGVKPSALTFHPHPSTVVAPERIPRLLSTPDERCALMAAEGIEQVLIMPFDETISHLSPEEFFRRVLVENLGARAVIVGANFRFGYRQAGSTEDLARLAAEHGVRAEIVPLLEIRGVRVSSSEIRRLLAEGNVSRANRLLERPYSIAGSVVPGAGRGAREVVPTLNLETSSLEDATSALPKSGVYVTRTEDLDADRRWNSITNIGFRPTFDGRHLTIETYLLDPFQPPPPKRIRVEFLRRLRPEKKFHSAAELRAQIAADVEAARNFFRRLERFRPSLLSRRTPR
ncbi:MAG: bifunctional riboflavin kinase/FAD synthetase [Bryobacteraceae bacterium]|nr:bifunctional riboflavin kinase/FAD synthetase [Bryobacteraceae bacterium]MCX7604013.1 bifunctional riboflavin kinase/FAD synthetase [Bryobacteraceae bacterium]